MTTKRKKLLRRIFILIIVFIAAVAVILFSLHRDEDVEILPEKMAEATLPVVIPRVEKRDMNILHGYTQEMDASSMRDTITPLPQDRALQLTVNLYGQTLLGVRYEIRSMDLERLVENTEVSDFTVNKEKDTATVKLAIQNLLEKNEEYQLIIILDVQDKEDIYYYTRVILSDDLCTDDMIDFVQDFHKRTLSDDADSSRLAQYLKNSSGDTDTYGNVSLNSSYKQLTWGLLEPKETVTPQISLTEINSSIGTFRLETQVKIKDDEGKNHLYQVEETYCVQTVYSSWYVLSFNRTVNQVFTGDENDVSNNAIHFGILSEESVQTDSSPDNNIQVFTLDGNLWMYHAADEQGSLTRLFSFNQDDSDIRADYNRHSIKVVNVEDSGDVDFLLYGYMNRGSHEGEIGLAFYHYNHDQKQLEEVFYLDYNKSYELLQEEIGKFSYVTENDLFYLMMNHKIYAIDFQGNESVVLVDQIKDDSLVISADSSAIAWQEEENDYGADSIQVLYLEDGHQNTISAQEDEKLRALGFIDTDFICGIVADSDMEKVKDTSVIPMYALQIVNKDGNVESRYEEKNIYISDITSSAGSVVINRVKITSEGTLKQISSDALIQNEAVQSVQEQKLTVKEDNRLMNVWTLAVNTSGYTGEYQQITQILKTGNRDLNIDMTSNIEDTLFYAYAAGYLRGVYTTVSEAITDIYEDVGCVLDQKGNYVYRRGYRDYQTLDIPQTTASNDEESLTACLEAFVQYEEESSADVASYREEGLSAKEVLEKILPGRTYDLTGCNLEQIVYYYNSNKQPLLGRIGNGYVLICGADRDRIQWYDPQKQTVVSEALDTAIEAFEDSGNVFVGYIQ